jgi:glucokinase
MWLRIYGQEISNCCIKYFPYGGAYITGGLANKMEDYMLATNHFIEGFNDKPAYIRDTIFPNIPLYYIKAHVDIGLRGALHFAKKWLNENGVPN